MPKIEKAAPQMQALYDKVMITARKVIYGTSPQDDQRFEVLVQKLKGAKGEIGDVIGQTVAVILTNVGGAAQKQGMPVPPQVLFAAGRELVAEIIHIAQSAKILPPGKQTAIEQQAIRAGIQAYQRGQQPPKARPPAPQQAAPQGAAPAPAATPPQPPMQPGA